MEIGELIIVLSMLIILSWTILFSSHIKLYYDRNNGFLKAIYVKNLLESEISKIVSQYSMNISTRAEIYLPYPVQIVNNTIYVDECKVKLNQTIFGEASGYKICLIYDGKNILVKDG